MNKEKTGVERNTSRLVIDSEKNYRHQSLPKRSFTTCF